ncbi:branched-chain amino acid ABC transporter permease [Ancylobacter sp.]|uniref:branched-chain amino acid ABC transporter permease n=1 Tax=Ancylobacter sp. TaxID=1872567 RepID=UPI003D0ADF34
MLTASVLIQLTIDGVTRGAMYGLMGAGLALIFGILGVINMAHGELFMLGAYAMYFATVMLGIPAPIGLLLTAGVMFCVGVTIERGLIAPLRGRLGSRWLVDGYVLTIGLMVVLQNLALIVFGPREYGVAAYWPGRQEIGDIVVANERLLILGGAVATAVALALFLKKTDTGRAIRATAEHPAAAQVLGIDIERIYAITFGIGAALAGAIGSLLLSTYPAYPTVGGEVLLKAFVVVIIGGLGSVWGAMLAGPLLGLIEAYATAFAPGGWQNTITSLLVLAVLVLRPQGLFSTQVTRP